jgi:hypothetical protein
LIDVQLAALHELLAASIVSTSDRTHIIAVCFEV